MTTSARATELYDADAVRVAIVSDLHAASHHVPDAHTFLRPGPAMDGTRNPFDALDDLIAQEDLRADFVLCPGDLGDKADPDGIAYAWQSLDRLRERLRAACLIATAGNHDIDSRFMYTGYDAKGRLQELAPLFPVADLHPADEYWSRHFTTIETDAARVVTLNSCAYHGYYDDEDDHAHPNRHRARRERDHGRVADRTLVRLRRHLEGLTPKPVNIVLCHHHPARFGVKLPDTDVMEGGDVLVELLAGGTCGRWAIVHGHKHYPNLMYAQGGGNAPVIFGAGSFSSADLWAELGGDVRNQFYVIEFPLRDTIPLGLPWAATFRSWTFIASQGWVTRSPEGGLPSLGGFGFRAEAGQLADDVNAYAAAKGKTIMRWSEVLEAFPRLRYLIPIDEKHLERELEQRGCSVDRTQDGQIREVTLPDNE